MPSVLSKTRCVCKPTHVLSCLHVCQFTLTRTSFTGFRNLVTIITRISSAELGAPMACLLLVEESDSPRKRFSLTKNTHSEVDQMTSLTHILALYFHTLSPRRVLTIPHPPRHSPHVSHHSAHAWDGASGLGNQHRHCLI